MKREYMISGLILAIVTCLLPGQVSSGGPTTAQRARIQRMIIRGTGLRNAWVVQRDLATQLFDTWRESGDEDDREAATTIARAANDLVRGLIANRDSIIAVVDSVFDCGMPPGTEVRYDANCGSRGYTSPRCYVRICEGPFTSPDEVASTKIHEAEHVKQKQRGVWGPDDVPRKCTKRLHKMEYDARQAQLQAHADGKIKLGSTSIARLEYEKDYCESHFSKRVQSDWQGEKRIGTLPGNAVIKHVAIANESDETMDIEGIFENEAGWGMLPLGFTVVLASEEETLIEVMVEVPPEAETGRATEVFCYAYPAAVAGSGALVAMEPDTATDHFFIDVTSTVEVTPGEDVSGLPDDSVAFHFTVGNLGTAPDIVQVDLVSTLGWTLSEDSWLLPLDPGMSVEVESAVMIPDSTAFATDLIMCQALSTTVPGQVDSTWLYATVEALAAIGDRGDEHIFTLMPVAPNPFFNTTVIRFSIPEYSAVDLRIYDVTGRLVRTLVGAESGVLEPGPHTVMWDGKDQRGRDVASGVYFTRLKASGRTATRKTVALD